MSPPTGNDETSAVVVTSVLEIEVDQALTLLQKPLHCDIISVLTSSVESLGRKALDDVIS